MSGAPSAGKLEQTFSGSDFSSHGKRWDGLWKESFTPWDRGGPSMALNDLVLDRRDLVPPSQDGGRRKKALVPGCGRGYDVLLLAALGYDVYGLDYSADAIERAVANSNEVGGEPVYDAREGVEKGAVTWLTGDFFADERLSTGEFDLIFDYTFFCALPPDARPKWAKRMSQLLKPDGGRLVCLEWPLHKPPATAGPPWGVTPEAYAAHLSRPGKEVRYDEDGKVADKLTGSLSDGALKPLGRILPPRTHKAGVDDSGKVIDFISVWSH